MSFLKNTSKESIIKISPEKYLAVLMIIAPLLNFLSGITFDLQAPSLPAIATYFSAPISAAKDTITISLFGFSIGCIIFGNLLDIFGRRPTILLGFLIYCVSSFAAPFCHSITELLFVRFLQGFSVSSLSIGCRTIIIDNFTDHDFKVAMLYSSLAFGLGPVIAPFFGGFLQYHFGWKANFVAYGVVSLIMMILFVLLVNESQKNLIKFSIKNTLGNYKNVLMQRAFIPGFLVAGISQVQLLVYTTTGAFIVEHVFHRTAIAYGNSALIVSCGYLFGTLTNRFMIKKFLTHELIRFGIILLFFSIMLELIFSLLNIFNFITLILPILLIGFANGFIFINLFSACLRLTTVAAGVATALFTSAVLLIGAIGTGIISHISTATLSHLFEIFGISFIFQLLIYTVFFRKIIKTM